MDEQKLTHKPHVGPEPTKAKPNHVREKTHQDSETPRAVKEEKKKEPDGTAREKASEEMGEATSEVKKRL